MRKEGDEKGRDRDIEAGEGFKKKVAASTCVSSCEILVKPDPHTDDMKHNTVTACSVRTFLSVQNETVN